MFKRARQGACVAAPSRGLGAAVPGAAVPWREPGGASDCKNRFPFRLAVKRTAARDLERNEWCSTAHTLRRRGGSWLRRGRPGAGA
jgi:hypothetical protein